MPIYKNETAATITESVETSGGQNKTIKIEPGKSKTTEFVLLDVGLTEVSPAPYFNPLMRAQTITSTGVGNDQTVAINRETKGIIIHNSSGANVVAFMRSTSNTPGLPVPANTLREVAIGCNVNQLVCQFSEAGSILVEERK
jgi:hypothetical protein